jgi:hypothetical protein
MTAITTAIPEDTLRYRIQAEKSLAQEKLKLAVIVTALVSTKDADHSKAEQRIRAALRRFVKADWTVSHVRRQADAVGYERLLLRATARVSPAQNYNLAERARNASSEGLSIAQPEIDYSLAPDQVAATLEELRLDLVGQATEQAKAFSRKTGRAWRVGDIEFGVREDDYRYRQASAKGALRQSGELEEDDAHHGLTGAEKIILVATVTLKASSPAGSRGGRK